MCRLRIAQTDGETRAAAGDKGTLRGGIRQGDGRLSNALIAGLTSEQLKDRRREPSRLDSAASAHRKVINRKLRLLKLTALLPWLQTRTSTTLFAFTRSAVTDRLLGRLAFEAMVSKGMSLA